MGPHPPLPKWDHIPFFHLNGPHPSLPNGITPLFPNGTTPLLTKWDHTTSYQMRSHPSLPKGPHPSLPNGTTPLLTKWDHTPTYQMGPYPYLPNATTPLQIPHLGIGQGEQTGLCLWSRISGPTGYWSCHRLQGANASHYHQPGLCCIHG